LLGPLFDVRDLCIRDVRSPGEVVGSLEGCQRRKKPYPLQIRTTVGGAGHRRTARRLWRSCRLLTLARHGHGHGHHHRGNGNHATAFENRQGLAHFSLLLVARYSLPTAVRRHWIDRRFRRRERTERSITDDATRPPFYAIRMSAPTGMPLASVR